jgi:hypothetical protein
MGTVTAAECRQLSEDCRCLAAKVGISNRHAIALMGLCRSWNIIADQIERYEVILLEEGKTA